MFVKAGMVISSDEMRDLGASERGRSEPQRYRGRLVASA
jgi:hypothetical protein